LVIKPKALLAVTNVTGSLSVGSSDVPLYITITNMGNITAHNIDIYLMARERLSHTSAAAIRLAH